MPTREMYALVNTKPNVRFVNCHELLTLVNKPESMETALYDTEQKDQALEDLEWHHEENGDHVDIKKLKVEDVEVEE